MDGEAVHFLDPAYREPEAVGVVLATLGEDADQPLAAARRA
jgi:hypothetical protein